MFYLSHATHFSYHRQLRTASGYQKIEFESDFKDDGHSNGHEKNGDTSWTAAGIGMVLISVLSRADQFHGDEVNL